MTAPRVSVLLPVRNGMPWLPEALASLTSQTFAAIEILALEDGSTDATPEVLASWPDARLRTIRTGGIGIGAALAVGLREARAPLVARQDADDSSMPHRLEREVTFLDRYPHVDLVGCVAEYVDERGRPLENDWVRTVRAQQDVAVTPAQIRDLMPLTCCLTHGSIVARADVLRAAGGYRAETVPAEDYDLWLRLLPHGELAKLPERLYRYRVHAGQASAQAKPDQIRQTIAAKLAYLRRRCPGLPPEARLAIVGTGTGALYYAAEAPRHGFIPVGDPPALRRERLPSLVRPRLRRRAFDGFDAIVVSNLTALEPYRTMFCADNGEQGLVRIGNFFVKPACLHAREAGREGAA